MSRCLIGVWAPIDDLVGRQNRHDSDNAMWSQRIAAIAYRIEIGGRKRECGVGPACSTSARARRGSLRSTGNSYGANAMTIVLQPNAAQAAAQLSQQGQAVADDSWSAVAAC
jgi:hypothetical protein